MGSLTRLSRLWLFRTPQRGPLKTVHMILSIFVAAIFVSGLWFTAMPPFPHSGYVGVSSLSEASPREIGIVFFCSLLGVTLFIMAFNRAVDRTLGNWSHHKLREKK